ncbi:MAG: hypothetical protein ACI4B5_05750 [Bacteroidaceae bacterium]
MKRANSFRQINQKINRLALAILAILTMFFCGMQYTAQARGKSKVADGYVVVTDHIRNDGKTDIAGALQDLIDRNPNRTIFFPDGTYCVSCPILTPADPKKSVSLVLANYACIRAIGEWPEKEAVIRLGGKDPFNTIYVPGSNYGLTGGIIDGNGVANGISIDSGRETRVCGVSIKRAVVGLHVKHGANSGSSDADVTDVNITGNGTEQSVGVLVEGFDNTFSNMRIADVNTGVWIKSAGNSLRNIHPLYIFRDTQKYETSCGFRVEFGSNWMNYCYSDQMATGFRLGKGARVHLTDCYCYWYNGSRCPFQTAIECDGTFEGTALGFQADFHHDCSTISLLRGEAGGKGRLFFPNYGTRKMADGDVSQSYIRE